MDNSYKDYSFKNEINTSFENSSFENSSFIDNITLSNHHKIINIIEMNIMKTKKDYYKFKTLLENINLEKEKIIEDVSIEEIKNKTIIDNYIESHFLVESEIENNIYFNKINIFLLNYKYRQEVLGNNFISFLKRKHKYLFDEKIDISNILNNEQNLKNCFKALWKIGLFVLEEENKKLQTNKKLKELKTLFFKNIERLDSYFKTDLINKNYKYPYNYDWFLFCSYWTTILNYKLFILFYFDGIIDRQTINDIYYFIPKPGYSMNIKRTKNNAQHLTMIFLITKLIDNGNNKKESIKFLKNFYESEIFKNDIIINYQKNIYEEGYYEDGGFIVHKNLVSYNYLLMSLYPVLFFETIFNNMNNNMHILLNSLFKIISFKIKKTNPNIISRFGKFNEVYEVLKDINRSIKNIGLFQNNKDVKKLNSYIEGEIEQEKEINLIKSVNVVSIIKKDWSLQLKIKDHLAYGEIDLINRHVLIKQNLAKIILFENIKIDEYKSNENYPGFFNLKNNNNSLSLTIEKGTKNFIFDKSNYAYEKINEEEIFIYSVVTNSLFNFTFTEIVLIIDEGIIVFYLNVESLTNTSQTSNNNYYDEDVLNENKKKVLYYHTDIYEDKVKSQIIFNDLDDINENKGQIYFNKNVVYSNLIEEVEVELKKLLIEKNKFYISLKISNRLYTFFMLNNKIKSIYVKE